MAWWLLIMSRGITRICPNLFRSLPDIGRIRCRFLKCTHSPWYLSYYVYVELNSAVLPSLSFFFFISVLFVSFYSQTLLFIFFYVKIKCLDVGLGLHRCRIHLQRKLLLCKTAVHTCCEYATLSGANVYYTVFPLVLWHCWFGDRKGI